MECGRSKGKESILALRGRANCCRLLTRDGRPESRFAARIAAESPPLPPRIRYNVRLLRFPASRRGRGPLRPPRRLKA